MDAAQLFVDKILLNELARLKAALWDYGHHRYTCPANDFVNDEPRECNCGWDKFVI